MIGEFHFLRPWWLLALLPCAFLWTALWRRQNSSHSWQGIVAPQLLPYLIKGDTKRTRFTPLYLIGICWALAAIAISGPTWRQEPVAFADDTAALAIVLKITPSMKTEDVQPDRLSRAVQKVHDLLAQRRGAKTALIAYAGTPHLVMPATTDEGIITIFAQALDPKIMPDDGDSAAEALKLADNSLPAAGSGSILWITDSIAPDQGAALTAWRKQSRTTIQLLPPLTAGAELDALRETAKPVGATLVRLTADDRDVAELARAAKYSSVAAGGENQRWKESGYWLTPILASLLLLFFRRGWMAQTSARS